MKKILLGVGASLASAATFAAGTVPVALQTAITDNSDMGVAIATALAVGVGAVTLLAKFYGKFGFR
ncbi:MAG: hypothetical protein ABIR79_16505 [Candidatus Binatia bacterium]